MTTDFQKVYAQKLAAQKEAILGSKITEQLEIKALSNKKLEQLYQQMSSVTGRPYMKILTSVQVRLWVYLDISSRILSIGKSYLILQV